MRKGTHSCLECRIRKIRCVWPIDSEQCNGCTVRKTRCLEQSFGDVPRPPPRTKRMRQRIVELEGAICHMIQHMENLGLDTASLLKEVDVELPLASTSRLEAATGTASVREVSSSFAKLTVSEDLVAELDNNPILALLNNDVLSSEKVAYIPNAQSRISELYSGGLHGTYNRILMRLIPLKPTPQTVSLIIKHSELSLCLIKGSFQEMLHHWTGSFDDSQIESLRDFITSSFESKYISTLTKVLITLATCIQQLPSSTYLGPPDVRNTLNLLQKRYMEFADAFLTPDEGLAGSIDGLDCFLMQVAFYINAGLPRKAWVIFRRAVTFAQLLGPLRRNPGEQELDLRKQALWSQMWIIDKALSLLLGLPYMLPQPAFKIETDTYNPVELPPKVRFRFKLGYIAARVIDRNNQGLAEMLYSETLRIDQDFERCRSIMPQSWWDTLPGSDMTLDAIYELCSIKMSYHNLRNHIHLPFVLKCPLDHKYHFSVITALESSRNMIRIYEIMRDKHRPVLKLCNMLDFYALTSALIIVIQLLRKPLTYSLQQQEQDWSLIHGLIRVLNRTAPDRPNSVAEQAAQLLEDLGKFNDDISGTQQSFHAVVPYFGEIQIRKRNEDLSQAVSIPSQQFDSVLFPPLQVDDFQETLLQIEPSVTEDNAEMASFTFNDFDFTLENSQVWPGSDEDWASLVGYTLQDGWDWDWNS
jgi:hypothetical protein